MLHSTKQPTPCLLRFADTQTNIHKQILTLFGMQHRHIIFIQM